MDKKALLEYCSSLEGVEIDQPFQNDNDTCIARHKATRKWLAAIMELDGRTIINLKSDPAEADFLRSSFKGITAAYHMNKWHWISVYLESDVSDELIRDLVKISYRLTAKKNKKIEENK